MSDLHPLPLLGSPPPERRDAARNREALMCAAAQLVAEQGAAAVTMDAVAARAGVGKGTVFRRFESREGLMAALLNASEAEWQGAVEDVQEMWRNRDPLASEERWTRWLEVRDIEEQARTNLDVAVDEYRGLSD